MYRTACRTSYKTDLCSHYELCEFAPVSVYQQHTCTEVIGIILLATIECHCKQIRSLEKSPHLIMTNIHSLCKHHFTSRCSLPSNTLYINSIQMSSTRSYFSEFSSLLCAARQLVSCATFVASSHTGWSSIVFCRRCTQHRHRHCFPTA